MCENACLSTCLNVDFQAVSGSDDTSNKFISTWYRHARPGRIVPNNHIQTPHRYVLIKMLIRFCCIIKKCKQYYDKWFLDMMSNDHAISTAREYYFFIDSFVFGMFECYVYTLVFCYRNVELGLISIAFQILRQ